MLACFWQMEYRFEKKGNIFSIIRISKCLCICLDYNEPLTQLHNLCYCRLNTLGILCDGCFSQNQSKLLSDVGVNINPNLIGNWALTADMKIVAARGHDVPCRISFWQ